MSENKPQNPEDLEKSPQGRKELTDDDLKEISGGVGLPPNYDLDAGARKPPGQ
jgi:bacteriocin-like protein